MGNPYNDAIMAEFRANDGRVSGAFAGAPMVILHTVGARSGAPRQNPLVFLPDGDRVVVFASKGGAPENPGWYHNLRANPGVLIELDATGPVPARAEEVTGPERDRLYAEQVRRRPQFAEYERRTDRRIPVVAITRG